MEDNLKISQMPPVETATGEEMIPCVTGSPKENKSVTVSKIRQGMVMDESYVHTDNNFTTQLKTKLDGIQEGAQRNTVIGVKGNAEQSYRAGNVNITKDNLGLSNVDNTSDAEKPVSTAQKTALDKKVDKVDGKELSTNDFTNDYKTLLEQIKMQYMGKNADTVQRRKMLCERRIRNIRSIPFPSRQKPFTIGRCCHKIQ